MNCKDCLHYDVCSDFWDTFALRSIDNEFSCVMFSDKSEWVHLPCKCGDKIFMSVGNIEDGTAFVDEGKVISVIYEHTGIWIYARYESGFSYQHKFGCGDYFFTKAEAEKALEESRKEDENGRAIM